MVGRSIHGKHTVLILLANLLQAWFNVYFFWEGTLRELRNELSLLSLLSLLLKYVTYEGGRGGRIDLMY